MFKKILSTAMSLFLVTGISCSSASASLPNFAFWPYQNNIQNLSEIKNFLELYELIIEEPLSALIEQFRNKFTFKATDHYGIFHYMILRKPPKIFDLAYRVQSLVHRIQPIADLKSSLSHGFISTKIPAPSELNQLFSEIKELISLINDTPECKPTEEDFWNLPCINTTLLNLKSNYGG